MVIFEILFCSSSARTDNIKSVTAIVLDSSRFGGTRNGMERTPPRRLAGKIKRSDGLAQR